MKLKTDKTVLKRIKVTSKGKLLRRHQFAVGHLKRNKSKSALNRSSKPKKVFAGEVKTLKRMLGI